MVRSGLNKIVSSVLVNFIVLFLTAGSVAACVTEEGQKVGPSGGVLPRFVSLSADEANMRTGPGRQYPIEWVYARRDLPLEVIDEFGPWRQVRDNVGTVGWMHVILLDNKRTAMIADEKLRLFEEASQASEVTIIADRGVIGSIEFCKDVWCKINIDGTSGWAERKYLWGVYPSEVIE